MTSVLPRPVWTQLPWQHFVTEKKARVNSTLALISFAYRQYQVATAPVLYQFDLEGVTQAQNDAAFASVRAPLIEEVSGVDASFGNTEIARIRRIEQIGAEL